MDDRYLIVGIGGTARQNSSTERALRRALAAARDADAETVLLAGPDLDLPLYDPGKADRTPAARRLVALLRDCDGVILASPGYHGSLSGTIKNAIDYVEDLRADSRPYLDERAVGCIAGAHGWQAAGSTLAALRSIVHALRGWPTPMGAALNTGTVLFADDGEVLDDTTRAQLELVGRQVVAFARAHRSSRSNPTHRETLAAE